jgi:hypothetical protein
LGKQQKLSSGQLAHPARLRSANRKRTIFYVWCGDPFGGGDRRRFSPRLDHAAALARTRTNHQPVLARPAQRDWNEKENTKSCSRNRCAFGLSSGVCVREICGTLRTADRSAVRWPTIFDVWCGDPYVTVVPFASQGFESPCKAFAALH